MARRPLLSSTTSLRKYSSGESLSLVQGERPSMFAYLCASIGESGENAAVLAESSGEIRENHEI